MSSWVIVDNKSKKAVLETSNKDKADQVNARSKTHKAVPILKYLGALNTEIKRRDRVANFMHHCS